MKIKRNLIFLILSTLLLISAVLSAYAWFVLPDRDANTGMVEIDLPPTIFVLNNETGSTEILNLDGMQIGDTYNIVFCVTLNKKNIVQSFQIQLAYTTNMKENINLYTAEFKPNPADVTGLIPVQSKTNSNQFYYYEKLAKLTESKNTIGDGYSDEELSGGNVQINNKATYKLFLDNDDDGVDYFKFETSSGEWTNDWSDKSQYLFYILEITWPDGISSVDAKETDILYVTAKEYLKSIG